jgi:serine/threonine protein kinase
MGKKYGKWELEGSVDEGGQSHVFQVRSSTGEPAGTFALKRLKNAGRIARFKAEIEAARRLSHPRVIRVVDAVDDASPPYLVMPYYRRGNAEQAGVPGWPVEARLAFFREILEAMEEAHKNGVVHRDLKPENVLVDDDAHAVVTDFGICFIDAGSRVTATEEAVGARNYIAPEAESGRADVVGKTLDVYSLGKLLYWLLMGRDLPREWHREERFDLVESLGDSKYELMNQLLDRLIATDPANRPPDAQSALAEFLLAADKFPRVLNYPSSKARQRCRYCGVGSYQLLAPQPGGLVSGPNIQVPAGLTLYNGARLRVMCCDFCGNLQTFNLIGLGEGQKKNPWTS